MIKIDDNGIEIVKGDIFNLLVVPSIWSNNAVYTATVTGATVGFNITCSLFRDKYVRLYAEDTDVNEGVYTLTIYKNGEQVESKPLIVKGVR